MSAEELNKPSFTVKQTADILGVHQRTVFRMLEDGRLQGKLVDTLKGGVWLIDPISIATLILRKGDLKTKSYPTARRMKETTKQQRGNRKIP